MQNICISQNMKELNKSGTWSFTTHNQHGTKDNFKIVKQFTQYRLLVNHNKYTFQYIIHNKYWKIKSNTGFLTGCSVIVFSLSHTVCFGTINWYYRPCWCHWLPESSLHTSFVPPRWHERSELLDSRTETTKMPVVTSSDYNEWADICIHAGAKEHFCN